MRPVYEPLNLERTNKIFNYLIIEKNYFQSYWHFHPELEISFVEYGRGIRNIGNSVQAFNEGDLILIGKNLPHSRESLGVNTRYRAKAHIFHFSFAKLLQFQEFQFLTAFLEAAKLGFHFYNPRSDLIHLIKQFSFLPPAKRVIVFLDLVVKLYEDKNRKQLSSISPGAIRNKTSKNNRINEVIDYINQNLQHEIKIEDLANLAHFSKSYFCRWFKKNTGNTFIEYLNKIRIEYICQQLSSNLENESIAQIAFRSGFQNISHFNRVFKLIKGCSPRAYMKAE